jgi:hypothetical protein
VVSPEGEILDVIGLDATALPTNCCFDGDVLWVTDFGRDFETVPGSGACGGWRPTRSAPRSTPVPRDGAARDVSRYVGIHD